MRTIENLLWNEENGMLNFVAQNCLTATLQKSTIQQNECYIDISFANGYECTIRLTAADTSITYKVTHSDVLPSIEASLPEVKDRADVENFLYILESSPSREEELKNLAARKASAEKDLQQKEAALQREREEFNKTYKALNKTLNKTQPDLDRPRFSLLRWLSLNNTDSSPQKKGYKVKHHLILRCFVVMVLVTIIGAFTLTLVNRYRNTNASEGTETETQLDVPDVHPSFVGEIKLNTNKTYSLTPEYAFVMKDCPFITVDTESFTFVVNGQIGDVGYIQVGKSENELSVLKVIIVEEEINEFLLPEVIQ